MYFGYDPFYTAPTYSRVPQYYAPNPYVTSPYTRAQYEDEMYRRRQQEHLRRLRELQEQEEREREMLVRMEMERRARESEELRRRQLAQEKLRQQQELHRRQQMAKQRNAEQLQGRSNVRRGSRSIPIRWFAEPEPEVRDHENWYDSYDHDEMDEVDWSGESEEEEIPRRVASRRIPVEFAEQPFPNQPNRARPKTTRKKPGTSQPQDAWPLHPKPAAQAPKTTKSIPVRCPSPPTQKHHDAAVKIQQQYRVHRNIKKKIQALNDILTALSDLSAKSRPLALTTPLALNEDGSLKIGAKANMPILGFEDALLKLMLGADGVESEGSHRVRAKRKDVVRRIQEELNKIDERKKAAKIEAGLGGEPESMAGSAVSERDQDDGTGTPMFVDISTPYVQDAAGHEDEGLEQAGEGQEDEKMGEAQEELEAAMQNVGIDQTASPSQPTADDAVNTVSGAKSLTSTTAAPTTEEPSIANAPTASNSEPPGFPTPSEQGQPFPDAPSAPSSDTPMEDVTTAAPNRSSSSSKQDRRISTGSFEHVEGDSMQEEKNQ